MVNLTRSRGQIDHSSRLELGAWVLTSALTYLGLYVVQRRLFTNGAGDGPYAVPRFTADLFAARTSTQT